MRRGFTPIGKNYNTLYSDLFDGFLEEISETEAKSIIAEQFSREKQAA